MIKLAITGARGRMGQRIHALALQDKKFKVITLLERADHPDLGKMFEGCRLESDLALLKNADVLIDFTMPEPTQLNVAACLKTKTKMIIGTTGLSAAEQKLIKNASRKIAIVASTNMSIGVNIFFKLTEILAQKINKNYHTRIIEAHHVHKKDAPSGTAKTLAMIIEKNNGTPVADIQSIREGEIVGDHDVIFESDVDCITLRHHAKTRDIFAQGALVAAKFIARKKAGLFNTFDVLGIK